MGDISDWPKKLTAEFIQLMLENKSEMSSTNFKASTYNKIALELLRRTGVSKTQIQLSQMYKWLSTEWCSYRFLRDQTTLGVHPTTGAIIETQEQWQTLEAVYITVVQSFVCVAMPILHS